MSDPWAPYSGEEEFHDYMTIEWAPISTEQVALRPIHGKGSETSCWTAPREELEKETRS